MLLPWLCSIRVAVGDITLNKAFTVRHQAALSKITQRQMCEWKHPTQCLTMYGTLAHPTSAQLHIQLAEPLQLATLCAVEPQSFAG